MFGYVRRLYQGIKEKYNSYRREYKRSPIVSFFRSIFDYILGRPKPFVLPPEQQEKFESGLDEKLRLNHDIFYGPGKIVLRKKSLVDRLD